MFDIRLRLYTPAGVKGRVLKTLSIDWQGPESESPTIRFTTSSRVAGYLEAPLVVGVEYLEDGAWVSPRNNLFIAEEEDGDALDVTETVTFTGEGLVPFLMGRTKLHWSESARDGERHWVQFPHATRGGSATAGYTLNGMLTESKNRGWGTHVQWDFTGLKDSIGQDWSLAGENLWWTPWRLLTPISQVLEMLAQQGFCEWWTEGFTLRMVKPSTGTARHNVVLGGPGFTRAPGKASYRDVFTHLTVVPEKARNWLYLENTGADTSFGRLEASMTQSGVDAHDVATRLAQPALARGKSMMREQSYEWTPGPRTPAPWVHFQVGDEVTVKTRAGLTEKQRVVGLAVSKTGSKITVRAVTGMKLRSLTDRLINRVGAATVGGTIGGTGSAFPTSRGSEPSKPVPVSGLTVVSNEGYFAEDGTARAKVKVSWAPVIADTEGAVVTVTQYQVWHRDPDALGGRAFPTDQTEMTLDLPSGQDVLVKVRAQSADRVWGDFSAEVTVTPALPVLLLAAPSTPTLTSELGTVTVSWDGLLGGVPPPAGFKHVLTEVLDGSAWVVVGQPMTGPGQKSVVTGLAVGANPEFRLVPYTILGNPGTVSDAASITVKGVELPDVESDITDAIQEALNAANTAQSTADGKTTISPNAPTNADGAGKPVGAIWWRRDGSGNIVGLWEWTGSAPWVVRPFDESFVPKINIGVGTYGELDGVRLKAASVTTKSLIVGDIENLALDLNSSEERSAYPATGAFAYDTYEPILPIPGAVVVKLNPTSGYPTMRVGEDFSVEPGEKLFVSYQARRGGSGDWPPVCLNLAVRDASGAFVATDLYAERATQSNNGYEWVTHSGIVTIPEGGVRVTPSFKRNQSAETTGGNWYFYQPVIRRAITGKLIVDGEVTTRHLKASEIWSDVAWIGLATVNVLTAGSIKTHMLGVGVGEAGQRIELVPSGFRVFDADNNPTISLGTSADDVIGISKKNSQGELVTVASIDTDGNISGNSLSTDTDIQFPSGMLMGGAGELTYNGQFVDTAFIERPPMGIIWSASLGEDSGEGRLRVSNSTASAIALGIGSVNLNPGRIYTIGLDSTMFARWNSGTTSSSLVLEMWLSSSTHTVTSPSGVQLGRWPLLEGADANLVMRLTPPSMSGIFGAYGGGDKNILIRVVNPSNRSATFYTIDTPPNVIIRDEGPDLAAVYGGVIYTRASTGNVSPPPANVVKTATFNATWSVLWGPSGTIRPAGGSLYDDGRMLQGGLSGSRAGQVGFPALGLSGKTITGAWLRLKNRHTYSSSGATVDIGTHGNSSAPSGSAPNNVNTFTAKFSKGQERWVPIPSSLFTALAAGTIRGFQIGGPNVNSGGGDYGIFDGYDTTNATGSGRVRPQLKVSYKG